MVLPPQVILKKNTQLDDVTPVVTIRQRVARQSLKDVSRPKTASRRHKNPSLQTSVRPQNEGNRLAGANPLTIVPTATTASGAMA